VEKILGSGHRRELHLSQGFKVILLIVINAVTALIWMMIHLRTVKFSKTLEHKLYAALVYGLTSIMLKSMDKRNNSSETSSITLLNRNETYTILSELKNKNKKYS